VGRNSAVLVDLKEAEERIREAARRSIALIGKAKPFRPTLPMEIILELYRTDYCDEFARRPGVERLDARTVRKVANNALDLFF
jgi:D-aminopeptidase